MNREQEVLEEIAGGFPGSEIKPVSGHSLFGDEHILFLKEEKLVGRFVRARFYVAVMPVKCVRADIYSSGGYQFSLATPYAGGIRERYRALQEMINALSRNSQKPDWSELERINFYKLSNPLER